MPAVPLVRVVRSGFEEAVHAGSVAVADADGRLIAALGEAHRPTFARSSMKPLQAAVSLTLAAEDLPDEEVAVMCGSHNGEPTHIATVRSLLRRAGLDFGELRTPPSRPLDEEAAAAVPEPRAEFHNCSGKHAGMLLASVRRGFDLETYREPDHPIHGAVLEAVRGAAGNPVAVGVDGCGIPVHALPLASLATMYARLATPGAVPGADRSVAAMRAAPYLVAGRNRMCTAVMEALPEVVVKVGAEGLVCAGVIERGIGVAVKVEDGSARAAEPALLRALTILGFLSGQQAGKLRPFARPPVMGGGRPVGELLADFALPA
ncbi:MAG: asparaginase [Actinomycetota bacterium]